ncbi:putative DEAD-box ATP-dependent RNA helicase 33 [Mucuna pruriens]|uniref:ATP-dependent RNA helicase n=1 Tax=Mucuna pruriens TaxID=157652 RepID=A0A371GD49_MUCPR|nr:putative DEAD-box ATP-dependent RNA helicase 33 [Mucuna pruriens]
MGVGTSTFVTRWINFLTMLLAIAVIIFGVWMSTHHDGCRKSLTLPVIGLGAICSWLFGCPEKHLHTIMVSDCAVLCLGGNPGLYSIGVILDMKLSCLLRYKEYQLQDFSSWFLKELNNSHNWEKLKVCLVKSEDCNYLSKKYKTLKQYKSAKLTPIEAGCCRPPSQCGYPAVNASYYDLTFHPVSPNNDCKRYKNSRAIKCYDCDSCKAGVAQYMKIEWRVVAIFNVVLFVFLREAVCKWKWVALRNMGGGPRTFPGGVNKWKWKRMHEKLARDKQKRLIEQEKQLYEARIRSHIRSTLSPDHRSAAAASHSPLSPHDQIKALADRFVKDGAQDLWNNRDGPLTPTPTPTSSPTPNLNFCPKHTRGYRSVPEVRNNRVGAHKYRVWRKGSDDSSSESESEGEIELSSKMGSSASLGEYDVKRERRVVPKLSEEVEFIRYELNKRKLSQIEEHESEEQHTILSTTRFDECSISPLTIKALSSAGYVHMTRVQEASLPICLEGMDALVKAKTGTGKSVAFLLPAIETVLKATSGNRVPPIFVLILCPTRELASQVAAVAKVLLKYHDGIGVQTLVGGIRFKVDQKRLESDPCQILVATPGRLLDHIENKSGISLRLMGLRMLVLDEADHLLDLGFRKDVEKIVDCLPRQRQSLLFSATIPKEVRRISQLVLKREHKYVDTVGIGCIETPVKQSYLIAPHESHLQLVHHVLKEHILQTPDYKVIVFCITGMVTSLMYNLLREMKMNVREIHSRKPQLYRTRISDEFRESKQLILVSSDVSSRGMNYPDVTLVIQVGIPSDREQYIHRLGRTGREGKEGEGILLIAPWEEYFLHEIKDLPLQKFPLPDIDPQTKLKIENSMAKIDNDIKEAAFHGWLGYYNSIREIGREKTTVAELANRFSESIGLQRPPAIFRKTAIKMGLKDIPGIRIRR